MTEENFYRAKEIIEDIKILKNQIINPDLSDSWKDLIKNTVEKLEEEFEKL